MSSSRSASSCTFTFSDGRRCRTPRQPGHPLFCTFHARRHDRINTADQLGREFAHFFSGRYLSACDLNTALGRLFAATVRGHVSAKTTRTLAYLAQVMVQCIHLTGHEYSDTFGGDGWRRSIRTSVNSNSDYLSPTPPPSVSPAAGVIPSGTSSSASSSGLRSMNPSSLSSTAPPSTASYAPPRNVPPSTPPQTPQPAAPRDNPTPRPTAFVQAGL